MISKRHSDFSLLDGFATVDEIASYSKTVNQKYLVISDHGMMAAVPNQIKAAEEHNLEPIFSVELYLNPDQPDQSKGTTSSEYYKQLIDIEEKRKFRKSYHLLGIAYNNVGYTNLVKLSSWGWTKGFYSRPRVNYEQLNKYKEGIIFTSCCYNSEIGQAFDRGGEEAGFEMVERYHKMFGENFRLEIMLLDFKKQKPYDAFIIKAHQKYGIPIVLTNDVHYLLKEDSQYQRLMLMIQTKNTLAKIQEQKEAAGEETVDFFELQDTNLWMKSEEELNEKWLTDYSDVIEYDILKQAKLNTVEICKKAAGVKLDRSIKLPQIEDADDKFMDAIMEGFKRRKLPKTREYLDRIKKEYTLICHKGFSSYFLIQKKMTDEARRVCRELLGWGTGAEAVGPGRGCLTPWTPIVVHSGIKPISEVEVGDYVKTIDRSYRKVLDKYEYNCAENILIFNTNYDKIGVGLTEDHKVYVCRKVPMWIKAEEVIVGELVFNGNSWVKIKSIRKESYNGKVYDLNVECNHNYLTSSFLVHNSAVGALTCYCLGITDVDPIKHDLLFDRFLSPARGGKMRKIRFTSDPIIVTEDDLPFVEGLFKK